MLTILISCRRLTNVTLSPAVFEVRARYEATPPPSARVAGIRRACALLACRSDVSSDQSVT